MRRRVGAVKLIGELLGGAGRIARNPNL